MRVTRLLQLTSVGCFLVGATLTFGSAAETHPWSQFRGPGGDGHASADDVPVHFGESENLKWKTLLPGKGWSSPVVSRQGTVWVTTAIENIPSREEQEALALASGEDPKNFKQKQIAKSIQLQVLEVDFETGEIRRTLDLFEVDSPDAIHGLNSYASPTPVLDGDRLYCHFGTYGTACLDLESGDIIWQKQFPLEHSVGPGSSPFIHDDRLILIQDGTDQQYVIALDKHSGRTLWKTDRPEMRAPKGDQKKAYCTPITIIDVRGREQLICMGSQWLVSYDPADGKERWRLDHGSGFSVVPRPVYDAANGLVFISTGFGKPELWAVKPDGDGDITDTDKVAWVEPKRIPAKPSPLLVGEELYVIQDGGIGTCFDAASGEIHWTERIGGNFSASPVHAEGRIYFGNHEGKVTVLAAGKEFEVLAENQLDGQLMASPAALDGTLLIRSDQALYRFE